MSTVMLAFWRWTFQGGVFVVMVLILRALLLERLPKRTFTVLWMAATIRLLLPVDLIFDLLRFRYTSILGLNLTEMTGEAVLGAAQRLADVTILGRALGWLSRRVSALAGVYLGRGQTLWLLGAALCALFFLIGHLRGRRVYAQSLPAQDPFVKLWLTENPMDRPVSVRVSDQIAAPLTYGVLRPVVLLPRTMDWGDREALAYVLSHEFHHVRRWDALRKWGFAAALCLHWFNPMVWIMYAVANRDLELECDEQTAHAFSWGSPSGYARALISLEERRSMGSPFASYFSQTTLEARVRALMSTKRCGALRLMAAALVVGALAMVCGASGTPGAIGQVTLFDYASSRYEPSQIPIAEAYELAPGSAQFEEAEIWGDAGVTYFYEGMDELAGTVWEDSVFSQP